MHALTNTQAYEHTSTKHAHICSRTSTCTNTKAHKHVHAHIRHKQCFFNTIFLLINISVAPLRLHGRAARSWPRMWTSHASVLLARNGPSTVPRPAQQPFDIDSDFVVYNKEDKLFLYVIKESLTNYHQKIKNQSQRDYWSLEAVASI